MHSTTLSRVTSISIIRSSLNDCTIMDVANDIVQFMRNNPEVGGQDMVYLFVFPKYGAKKLEVQVIETELGDKEFQQLTLLICEELCELVQIFIDDTYKRIDSYVTRCRDVDNMKTLVYKTVKNIGYDNLHIKRSTEMLAVADESYQGVNMEGLLNPPISG